MKHFPLDPGFLWQLFFAGGAGVELAGESGSGKSQALLAMLRTLLNCLHFVVFIDPDNDTAEALYHHCISDPRLAPRTVYFKLNDPSLCGSFDPNAIVPHHDPTVVAARRSAKIEQKSKIQLSAWGESNFDSRPTLAKNSYRVAHTCSRLGLPPVEEMLFLDTASEIYPVLCQGVENPIHRAEMLELPNLRPVDREGQLGSFKNRMITMYDNPLTRAVHAKTAASGAYSFEEGYNQGHIAIFNGHLGTSAREMDRQVWCNEILTEYFSTVMSRPRQQRRESLLCVEELPVFQNSHELLAANLPRIRKFLGRMVFCHQGVHTFEGGVESRILNLVRSMCRTHFFFRSSSSADAKFTAEQISLPTLNLKKTKYRQYELEQYQAGNRVETLRDQSSGENETSQQGGGSSLADTTTDTNTGSHADHSAVDALRGTVVDSQSHAASQGQTSTASQNWSNSRGRNRSVTVKQSLVPVMAWRRVLRKIEFWSADEQYMKLATRISRQATGACLLFINGAGAQEFQFPLLPEPFARTPRFGQRKIEEFEAMLLERPEFDSIENVEAYRQRFLEILIDRLRRLPAITSGGIIVPPESLQESPVPPDNPNEKNDGPWTI